MADLDLEWGGDLSLGADGDLVLADGDTQTRQALERRLLTAVRGYVWHQEYGAGLPERIGKVALPANIRAVVRSQVALESSVAPLPVPKITVNEDETIDGLFNIRIEYTNANTGQPADPMAFSAGAQR